MRTPTRWGPPACATNSGAVGNPACGDVLTIHLCIQDGKIADAGFESMGSAYQLATASVLCECIIGLTVTKARQQAPQCMLDRLPDLPQHHRYLARLAIDALRKALDGPIPAGAKPPGGGDVAGAKSFVLRCLGNGKPWTSAEIEAMAEAEAIDLPGVTARFLSGLRKDGVIAGDMDVNRKAWTWKLTS